MCFRLTSSTAIPTLISNMSATPFTIAVPDSAIDRLNDQLSDPTFQSELETNDQWKYGAPLSDVKRLAKYWRDEYDWREAEKKLNQLPHFRTKITVTGFQPLDIHFVHQKSEKPGAIPLLFVHGCEFRFGGEREASSLITK